MYLMSPCETIGNMSSSLCQIRNEISGNIRHFQRPVNAHKGDISKFVLDAYIFILFYWH